MFNVLLKELRSKKGITQSQLAQAVGVSPGNVGDWETGKSKPGYNALASLSRIFEVSADYLLEIDSSTENSRIDLSDYKSQQGLVCDGNPLIDTEADIIAMYRLLPEIHKEEIFDLIYFKYKRHVEMKKESIYSTYTDTNEQQKSSSDLTSDGQNETA